MEVLMTVKQYANYKKLSERHVRRLMASKKIKVLRSPDNKHPYIYVNDN